jgi:hypothetical protein
MSSFKINENGNEIELKVKMPSVNDKKEAQKVYNRTFREALANGDLLRVKLDEELRKQGLWDNQKQIDFDTLTKKIVDGEKTLLQGGKILKTLENGRALALEIKKWRRELDKLWSIRTSVDNVTVDAQADNARFNYLVSVCTVYSNNGKPYFKDYNDYLSKIETVVANLAANELFKLMSGDADEYEKKYTENKFLAKWKFIDDKGRLINKDGHLIDQDGRLINEDGYYVKEDGSRCDIDGNPLDDNGDWKLEYEPFVDENGNTIEESGTV